MSDEQPKNTPAQIRAEKRRARILGRGNAGASQISGDRIAPGLDFPQPGTSAPSTNAGNEEFEKQIEKIMSNSTCDRTKRNLATSPKSMVKNIIYVKYISIIKLQLFKIIVCFFGHSSFRHSQILGRSNQF